MLKISLVRWAHWTRETIGMHCISPLSLVLLQSAKNTAAKWRGQAKYNKYRASIIKIFFSQKWFTLTLLHPNNGSTFFRQNSKCTGRNYTWYTHKNRMILQMQVAKPWMKQRLLFLQTWTLIPTNILFCNSDVVHCSFLFYKFASMWTSIRKWECI